MRRSNRKIHDRRGYIDAAKFASFTEADIERFAPEDDRETHELGEPRFVPGPTDVRALRERLGLSQSEFARRYWFSVRTVQHWEQEKREPSEPARILLYAIARDPVTMERILRRH